MRLSYVVVGIVVIFILGCSSGVEFEEQDKEKKIEDPNYATLCASVSPEGYDILKQRCAIDHNLIINWSEVDENIRKYPVKKMDISEAKEIPCLGFAPYYVSEEVYHLCWVVTI